MKGTPLKFGVFLEDAHQWPIRGLSAFEKQAQLDVN
jgi:hypothetical protein